MYFLRRLLSKQGFKTALKPDVILHVQDVIALNFTLPVGSASESVTVTSGEDGFTEDELKAAKSGWLQSRKVRNGYDSVLAGNLANYLFLNRTYAWDAELEKKVESVTAEQAHAALQKYIDPAKLTIVTAGSFAAAAK